MRNIHKREARIEPRNGKWEAYFADAPRERCHGDTPQLALAALRKHAAVFVKASAVVESTRSTTWLRGRNVIIFASVFLAVLLATAFIVQATANVANAPHKMYAHHRTHHDQSQ